MNELEIQLMNRGWTICKGRHEDTYRVYFTTLWHDSGMTVVIDQVDHSLWVSIDDYRNHKRCFYRQIINRNALYDHLLQYTINNIEVDYISIFTLSSIEISEYLYDL